MSGKHNGVVEKTKKNVSKSEKLFVGIFPEDRGHVKKNKSDRSRVKTIFPTAAKTKPIVYLSQTCWRENPPSEWDFSTNDQNSTVSQPTAVFFFLEFI